MVIQDGQGYAKYYAHDDLPSQGEIVELTCDLSQLTSGTRHRACVIGQPIHSVEVVDTGYVDEDLSCSGFVVTGQSKHDVYMVPVEVLETWCPAWGTW